MKRRERDLNPRMLAHTGSQGPRPTELGDLCKNCLIVVIKICSAKIIKSVQISLVHKISLSQRVQSHINLDYLFNPSLIISAT